MPGRKGTTDAYQAKKLLFQALLGDSKVDQSALRGDLRFVVRVCKLGLDEQPEVVVEVDLDSADFDEPGVAALNDSAGQHRIQSSVQLLAHTLDQHGLSELHSLDDLIEPQPSAHLNHLLRRNKRQLIVESKRADNIANALTISFEP
mgnify:CR=1 FL=1